MCVMISNVVCITISNKLASFTFLVQETIVICPFYIPQYELLSNVAFFDFACIDSPLQLHMKYLAMPMLGRLNYLLIIDTWLGLLVLCLIVHKA